MYFELMRKDAILSPFAPNQSLTISLQVLLSRKPNTLILESPIHICTTLTLLTSMLITERRGKLEGEEVREREATKWDDEVVSCESLLYIEKPNTC